MATILNPNSKVLSVVKTSTPEEDKANSGYGRYEVTAAVKFNLYSDTGNIAELTEEAEENIKRALA